MVQMASMGMVGLATLQGDRAPRKQRYKDPTGSAPAQGAVRSGHLLFLSGIGGLSTAKAGAKPGDINAQTTAALDLMEALLKEAGSSMADLLQVQVALVDAEKTWEPMTEIYNKRVPEPRPVRSYFGATGFGRPGQLVQFDAIAYVE
jgi:2-iminobutanoate/2-iminopropanoate deaminase